MHSRHRFFISYASEGVKVIGNKRLYFHSFVLKEIHNKHFAYLKTFLSLLPEFMNTKSRCFKEI